MKRVLFYGRINKPDEAKVEMFLKELIRDLLLSDYIIITREGTAHPEKYDSIWLDNMVLEIACNWRNKLNLPYDRVQSFSMDDDLAASTHDRVMMVLSSNNRLVGYQEMLDNCDAVISLGGTEGVYRLGLFSVGTKKLFIPFAMANGTSKQLVKEFKSILEKNYSPDFYPLISRNILEATEINKFVQLLSRCIEQKRVESKTITEEDFLYYLDNNPEKLKKLSPHYIWRLLKKMPMIYWISAAAFLLLVLFMMALELYSTYLEPIVSAVQIN